MQEVQALCDRVIIINKGNLAADGTIQSLQENVTKETQITIQFNKAANIQKLQKALKNITIKPLENNIYHIISKNKEDIRPTIFNFAVREGLILLEMHQKVSTIEDVFQKVTQ
jgi:ABC-2 type transport system ATP-binding protein